MPYQGFVGSNRRHRIVKDGLERIEFHLVADPCLLYTSDAADERSSVDLGGRRIIKKKTQTTLRYNTTQAHTQTTTNDKSKVQNKRHVTQNR